MRLRKACLLSPLLLAWSGCAQMPTSLDHAQQMAQSGVERLMPALENIGNSAVDALVNEALAPNTPPMFSRNPQQLAELFNRRVVSGRELIDELKAMRMTMSNGHNMLSVQGFMGSLDESFTEGLMRGQVPGLSDLVVEGTVRSFELLLRQAVMAIAFQQLDGFFQRLIDDPAMLDQEVVHLPPAAGLTPKQLQRGATMAAMVVATRMTAKILKKAKEDFAGLETEYAQLLVQREAAAQLLYDFLARKPGSAELSKMFDGGDLAYLLDNIARMPIKDFVNDLGTQNLALRYLQRQDPKAYAAYRARADNAVGLTRGLMRTTAGVVAFGALGVNFGQSLLRTLRGRNVVDILLVAPMAVDFVKEAPPVMLYAWEAGAKGAEVLMRSNKRFRLLDDAGTVTEVSKAKEVFEGLKKAGEPAKLLDEALFRDGSPGLVYRLYQCDKQEAGRLLDAAVPMGERERFAKTYLGNEVARFAFANQFEQPGKSARERDLGDDLLKRDHRRLTNDPTRAFAPLQQQVSGGYAGWGDEQLMRLIFANREGQAVHATLQLGSLRVRPIPSMQSIYAYESLVDACREAVGAKAVRRGAPAPRATPRSVPAPAPKAAPPKPPAKSS